MAGRQGRVAPSRRAESRTMTESGESLRVVFRPMVSVVLGSLVVVLAAVLMIDTIRRGSGAGAWALASGLALAGLIVWVASVRPAVVAEDVQVVLRNPFRDYVIPWSVVDDMRLRFQLDLHVDIEVYHAWAVPVSTRGRLRAQRQHLQRMDIESKMGPSAGGYAATGQNAASFAERTLAELTIIWNQRKGSGSSDDSVTTRWSWQNVGALTAAAVVFAVALVVSAG